MGWNPLRLLLRLFPQVWFVDEITRRGMRRPLVDCTAADPIVAAGVKAYRDFIAHMREGG